MRKVTKDKDKAKSLLRMADKSLARLKETNREKFPAQTLRDYYDILRQLMEALAASSGVKSEGRGAHKKLIDWISEEYSLGESDRNFLQQLRRYRNRIEYEGFAPDYSYLERNQSQIEHLISQFKQKLQDSL